MNECGFPLGAHYTALLPCPNILQLSSSPSHFADELHKETTNIFLSCMWIFNPYFKKCLSFEKVKPLKNHCSAGFGVSERFCCEEAPSLACSCLHCVHAPHLSAVIYETLFSSTFPPVIGGTFSCKAQFPLTMQYYSSDSN